MKIKILNSILAFAVAASMIVPSLPVKADAGTVMTDNMIFIEDFQRAASLSDLSGKWYIDGNTESCAIETKNQTRALSLAYASGAAPVLAMAKNTFSQSISAGTVRVSFDVCLENTQNEILSFLDYIHSGDQTDYGQYHVLTIHKPEGGSAYIEGIEVQTAEWYNVIIDFNLGSANTWSYGIGIYDSNGLLVGSTGESGSVLMGDLNNINFTAWRSGKIYVDNVEVKTINRMLPFYDDMDSYSSNGKSALINWNCEGYAAGTSGFEEIDAAHGMTAYVQSETAPRFAPYRVTSPLTEGKVELEFDTYITNEQELWNRVTVVPSSTTDFGARGILNISCNPGEKANISTASITEVAGNLDANSWYTVKITFDLDKKIYTVSVYDEDKNKIGNTITEYNSADALSDFSTVNFTTWREGKFYFDNVNIEYPMFIDVRHNGIGEDSDIIFDRNNIWFEATVKNDGREHDNLTVQYTITDSNGAVVSNQTRFHPVNIGETAVERFNAGALDRGEYTLTVKATDKDNEAVYSGNIIIADITKPSETKNTRIGVHANLNVLSENKAKVFASAAGFGWIRGYLSWERCETVKGEYTFPEDYESYINNANSEGINVIEELVFGNRLYNNNEVAIPVSGEYKQAYLNYVKAFVSHFKGRIRAYEVWNEPNAIKFNANNTTAAQYASLLRDVYSLIKSIDPDALVIGVALSGADTTYMDSILAAGAAEYMDAFSIHPYNKMYIPETRLTYDIKKVRTRLDARGYTDMPIWVTEHGYFTSGENGYNKTEDEQAKYLVRSAVLYDDYCKDISTVGKYMWYNLNNLRDDPDDVEYNFGLLEYDYTPKNAYYAAAAFNKLTAGMELDSMDKTEQVSQTIVVSGSYNACYKNNEGTVVNVLWNAFGTGSKELNIGNKATVYNMYGDIITQYEFSKSHNTITVATGEDPVYVVSGTDPDVIETDTQNPGLSNITIYTSTSNDTTDVYIRGTIDGGSAQKNVSLLAMPEGESFSDFAAAFNGNKMGYADTVSTTDGSFAFDLTLTGRMKAYSLSLYGTDIITPYNKKIVVGKLGETKLWASKNNTEITDASQISGGDLIKICASTGTMISGKLIGIIEYSSGNKKFVIEDAFYNGEATIETAVEIPQDETVKSIKLMLWSSMSEMVPQLPKLVID